MKNLEWLLAKVAAARMEEERRGEEEEKWRGRRVKLDSLKANREKKNRF